MSFLLRLLLIAVLCGSLAPAVCAQENTVIFMQPGFPVADTSATPRAALTEGFRGARPVNAAQLPDALASPQTNLLVLPYGSAYPEAAWPSILRYLDRGGNLIVLGGKPFTRAAYQEPASAENATWRLRAPSVAASLELFIQDYQTTPGSQTLRFQPNADVEPQLPAFAWSQAYSPVIRLSVTPISHGEIGSAGSEDASLTTLAWGTQDGHKLAAPALLIDHSHNRFVGGRWIFLACTPQDNGFNDPRLLQTLQTLALRKNDRFIFLPRVPLFLKVEALEFQFKPTESMTSRPGDTLHVTVQAEEGAPLHFTFAADATQTITLPQSAAAGAGLHTVEAALWRDGAPVWTYRSGFWMRDRAWLLSGPKLTVNADYFELNGKPLPVVGTTYMASDVDREFLAEPNAYVWDNDMRQIQSAGLNSFAGIEPPPVTIVTSQSLLYTGMWNLAVATQKKSLRALAYYERTPASLLPENRLAQLGHPKLVILPAAQALTDTVWQQLLEYVAHGGCLLVSGPVPYDEHWQKVDRLTPLHLQATVFPIAVRQSALTLPSSEHALPISYPAAVQQAPLDTMRFEDGASVKVIQHGAGKLIWAAEPVEFSEDYDATAALYAYAVKQAGVEPAFKQLQPLPPGVLAFPTMLKDAILSSFSSESLNDAQIDLEDAATHARLHFTLPSQRGAMILLNRSNGAVLSSYGIDAGR